MQQGAGAAAYLLPSISKMLVQLRKQLEWFAVQLGGEAEDLVRRSEKLRYVATVVVGAFGGVSEGFHDLLAGLAASAANHK